MKKREPVSKIMSTDIISVNSTNTLFDVKEIFDTKKVRHILVLSGKEVLGILSNTDFARVTYGVGQQNVKDNINNALFHTLKIEDVMTEDPLSIDSKTTIHEAAEIFTEKHFHALPVVDDGEVKGIITTTDVIKYLVELY